MQRCTQSTYGTVAEQFHNHKEQTRFLFLLFDVGKPMKHDGIFCYTSTGRLNAYLLKISGGGQNLLKSTNNFNKYSLKNNYFQNNKLLLDEAKQNTVICKWTV